MQETDHAGDGHAATIPAQGAAQVGTGPRAAHIQQETNQGTYESPHIMSTPLTTQQAVGLYTTMRKIRRFEETVKAHIGKEIVGPAHLYIGEEAVATGVCSNLTHHDYVTSTHRGHGHTLAKGARIDRSLAELYGRATGYCKGKGGSMHLADFSVGMLGANGVVGGGRSRRFVQTQGVELDMGRQVGFDAGGERRGRRRLQHRHRRGARHQAAARQRRGRVLLRRRRI